MGSTDYGEILLSAVNTLIEKSIEDLHFDRTIKCEIIDDRDKKFGKYIVSDGSAKMEAYCETADKYTIGDQIYVTIPRNDYTQKKIITSKYVENDDAKPIAYIPPLGTFLNMSGNLCNSCSSWGIRANSGQIYKQIASIDLINGNYDITANDTKVCDTIGIAADFKTLFGGVDIRKGNFGLRVDLFTYANKENKETYDNVVSITFDNTQMFGNPYNYQIPLRQEVKINKGDLLVWGANIYLYQQNNFETQENQSYDSSNILGDNIIVSNIMLSFGQDLLKLKDDNFTISTKDELTYDKENTVKTIHSNWINKDPETNEFIGFSDGVVDLDYDEETYIKEYAEVMQGASIVISEEDNPIPDTAESLQLYANAKSLTQEVKKIENYFNDNLYIVGILNDLKRNLIAFDIDANTINGIIDSIGKQFVADNYAQGRLIEIPYINYLQEKFQNHDYKWLNDLTEWENLKIQINSTIIDIGTLYNTLLSGQINNAKTYVESSQNRILNVISKINESLTVIMDRIENANAHLITILDQDTYWNSPNARPFRQRYDDFAKTNANRYCIYWYHYNKGYENLNDPFISKDWERIQFDDTVPGMPNIIIEDNEYEKTSTIPYITNSLSMDVVEEKYKAILFFNHHRIDSNELVFTNNKPTSMAIAGDLNNALYIEVGVENSNSMESHQLYNQYYTLLKASDQFINRKIRVRFDGVQGKDEMLVSTQVFWYVPTQATMLRVDDTKLKREGFSLVENNGSDDAKYYRSGYVCYYRNIAGIDTDDTIIPIDADTYFWYQVAPMYNPTLTNNTIICKVIKDNQEYHTEKLFTFSTYGNNGTDYTVSIVPTGNQSAVVENNDLQLQAIFSDYEGKELEAPSYKWSWQGPSYFKQIVDNEHPELLKTTLGENVPFNFCLYNIAKVSIPWDKINATVGANETLNLVGLRAIPYAASVDYYIQGASTIIYNDLGVNPQYENMPYKIFDGANDGAEIIDVTWELMHYTEDGEEYSPTAKDFVPSIYTNKSATEYYLKPSTMYIVDQSIYSVAVCKQGDIILYAQPIYIGQNRYSSPMLNSWDESLQIDETNNTVMSAMMGAGYKDNLNRFNGVLMGNVGPKAQIDSIINAGIYGFNEGAQSFAWKVDGTGFIGKSGKGRIEFDGNNGVIKSALWDGIIEDGKIIQSGTQGMCIDLQDGHIDAYDFKLSSNNIELNSNPSADGYYLNVNQGALTLSGGENPIFKINVNGLYVNSSPSKAGECYLHIGDTDEYIKFIADNDRDKLEIKVNSLIITGTEGFQVNQETLFNQLTGNKESGLYLQDGYLYVNADWMQTGLLRSRNWNGQYNVEQGLITQSGTEGTAISLTTGQFDARDFSLSSESIAINSAGNPYLEIKHSYINYEGKEEFYPVLKIANDGTFKMQSLPLTGKKENIYYVISNWSSGANVRAGTFNDDKTALTYVDGTDKTPIRNYPNGSKIPVTTQTPYPKTSGSELWYETIDGYFVACRGGSGQLYLTLEESTATNEFIAFTGYRISTSNSTASMNLDIQNGKIEMIGGGNYTYYSESGEEIETVYSGAIGKLTIDATAITQPFSIGNLSIDWTGTIGTNKWSIASNGEASFGWMWASTIRCNSLICSGVSFSSMQSDISTLQTDVYNLKNNQLSHSDVNSAIKTAIDNNNGTYIMGLVNKLSNRISILEGFHGL